MPDIVLKKPRIFREPDCRCWPAHWVVFVEVGIHRYIIQFLSFKQAAKHARGPAWRFIRSHLKELAAIKKPEILPDAYTEWRVAKELRECMSATAAKDQKELEIADA